MRTIFIRVIPESAVSCARDPGEFRYWAKTLDPPARGFETHSLARVKILRSLAPSLRLPALVIYQPRLYHLGVFMRLER